MSLFTITFVICMMFTGPLWWCKVLCEQTSPRFVFRSKVCQIRFLFNSVSDTKNC